MNWERHLKTIAFLLLPVVYAGGAVLLSFYIGLWSLVWVGTPLVIIGYMLAYDLIKSWERPYNLTKPKHIWRDYYWWASNYPGVTYGVIHNYRAPDGEVTTEDRRTHFTRVLPFIYRMEKK